MTPVLGKIGLHRLALRCVIALMKLRRRRGRLLPDLRVAVL